MIEIFYIILFFVLGSYMGSFYSVVGYRLPKKENFVSDHSKCDSCNHRLSLYEMIPIFSYLIKKGKCSYCGKEISSLFFTMEIATGLLFAVAYYSFGLSLSMLIALGIISLLIIITVSDLTYLIIPDEVLIFFSIYFIIIQLFRIGIYHTLLQILTGTFLFVLMYIIMVVGNKIFKKESMGGGDVKMMFLFGLVLDPLLGTLTIFFGSLFALPISISLYYTNKEHVIPFGPFLVLAFAFIFFTKMTPADVISWFGFR